jgi:hypothetical protein
VETKSWVKPHALGKTPLAAALQEVWRLLYDWTRRYATQPCFPPIVFHISDGEATDAEEAELLMTAEKLRELKTADGSVLMMNIYIGNDPERQSVLFPQSEEELPDTPYARMLYRMSSPMPEIYHPEIAAITGTRTPEKCRGMSYNASMTDLIGMLRIGSKSVTLLS